MIAAELSDYHIHPAVLDACLQTAAGALQMAEREGDRSSFIPVRMERFHLLGEGRAIAWCRARVIRADRSGVTVDFTLLDADGGTIAAVEGLRLRRIGEILGTTEEAAKNCLFRATQKMRAALGDFV